jgi:uncharacterized protein (DUF433 family)
MEKRWDWGHSPGRRIGDETRERVVGALGAAAQGLAAYGKVVLPCIIATGEGLAPGHVASVRRHGLPAILGGKACICGMRIAVSLVVNLVANGMSTAEIIAEYPDLEPEDIRQALQYAAWAADDAIFAPISAAA